MRRVIRPLFASFLLLLTSCEVDNFLGTFNFDFSQPAVMGSIPANREENVGEDAAVTVYFSREMDRIKTENEFTLSSSGGRVKGYFTWDPGNRIMTFHPTGGGLTGGRIYTVMITAAAEDTAGNDLAGPYSSVFYVGSDITPPEVVRHTPAHNAFIADPHQNIEIIFSEPMDYDSIHRGFSISPSVAGIIRFEERFDAVQNRMVTAALFDPTYPLPYGTTYSVTVFTAAKDPGGNAVREECFFNFTVGNDFQPPAVLWAAQPDPEDGGSVTLADPTGAAETMLVEKDCDIIVQFSENVKSGNLQGAITISNGADFYLIPGSPPDRVTVRFREPLKSDEHYLLTLSKSIADLYDNPLDRVYRYRFFTNGKRSAGPQVVEIRSEQGGDSSVLADDSAVYPVKIGCRFTVAFSREMNPAGIDVSVIKVAGPAPDSPDVVNPDWDATFTKYSFDLHDTHGDNTYKITVEGPGVTEDKYGNYLEKDVCRYVKYWL